MELILHTLNRLTDKRLRNTFQLMSVSFCICNKFESEPTNFSDEFILRYSLFYDKVAGLRPATLLKKRLCHRCFPVNFAKFLGTTFFTEHLWTTASNTFLSPLCQI